MSRAWSFFFVVSLLGCRGTQPSSPIKGTVGKEVASLSKVGTSVHPTATSAKLSPLPRCEAVGLDPLSAARKFDDEGQYDKGLSCANQAAALRPEDPLTHSERGIAAAALGHWDDAKIAFARALALEPDHLEALRGAAHLYSVSLPSSRQNDELGSVYAEHGLILAEEQQDKRMIAEFALLSAIAFNDLGMAQEALARAQRAAEIDPDSKEIAYERAVALFELCRFPEAKAAFTALLSDPERSAHAHYHLGLLLEREGKLSEAEAHLKKARSLAPDDFPAPQTLSAAEFQADVNRAVAGLPADMRQDLTGVPVQAEDLPKQEDLLSGDPPLSPAILGLYRGPPLNEACSRGEEGPCRSVVLYRNNLARAVRTKDELLEQIRVTLLHEIGHLRGEDDFELAARGLE